MISRSNSGTPLPDRLRGIRRLEPLLWPATVGLSAFLLFFVQPMVARLLTPLMGGSSSVWNVALVFFQTVLLAGYGYAHLVQRLPQRAQLALHGVLLALAAALLPRPGTDLSLLDQAGLPEPARVLLMLGALVGVPYLMLTTHGPLLQNWFARAHGDSRGDPYRLSVVSNAASLGALLAYPLLVEPLLGLQAQIWLWNIGFGLLVCCVVGLGLTVRGAGGAATPVEGGAPAAFSWREVGAWVGFAALPSGLVVGITSTISNDIGAFPLMWTLPLAVYLLTLQQAFGGERVIARIRGERPAALVLLLLLLALVSLLLTNNIFVVLAAGLAGLYFVARAFHGELVARRPEPRRLTAFYLWMAVGGALGGGVTALLAPVVFSTALETPLLLVAAAVALTFPQWRGMLLRRPAVRIGIAALGVLALALAFVALSGASGVAQPVMVALVAALALTPLLAVRRPHLIALVPLLAAALGLAGALGNLTALPGRSLLTERSFYGVHRVLTLEDEGRRFVMLAHGTTVHGIQRFDPGGGGPEVIGYYAPVGPLGSVFGSERMARAERVGMVGLGAGVTACYAQPGQQWDFYELDEAVIRIAEDPALFTYLRDCAPGATVVPGDARVTLRNAPDGAYDLLIIDAYSGDTVPMHLMTSEAFALYRQKLKPDGVLALHITNRLISLAPLIAPLADAHGLTGAVGSLRTAPEQSRQGVFSTVWVVLSPDAATAAAVVQPGWRDLAEVPRAQLQTDDRLSILPLLSNLRAFNDLNLQPEP